MRHISTAASLALLLLLLAAGARPSAAADSAASALMVPPRIVSISASTRRDPTVDSLLASIGDWANAWSAKDVPRYLAFYSAEFQPERNQTLPTWRAERDQSLRRPSRIDVRIVDVRVKPWEPDTWRVCFIQQYRSSTRQESNLKVQHWRREGKGWRIVREQVLA